MKNLIIITLFLVLTIQPSRIGISQADTPRISVNKDAENARLKTVIISNQKNIFVLLAKAKTIDSVAAVAKAKAAKPKVIYIKIYPKVVDSVPVVLAKTVLPLDTSTKVMIVDPVVHTVAPIVIADSIVIIKDRPSFIWRLLHKDKF